MKKFKGIAISAGRSDYDRYLPILQDIRKNNKIKFYLFLTKDHTNPKFGNTINLVNKKFNLIKKNYNNKNYKKTQIENLSDDLYFFSKKIKKIKPNFVIVLGDRYEMLLGPILAIPNRLPVFHFFGGAITEGSSDELIRHAITKISHVHFVAHKIYKDRLLQMGEENWRVFNIGVPSLLNIKDKDFYSKKNLKKKYNFNFNQPFALITYHPTSDEIEKLKINLNIIEKFIKKENLNVVITYPNADFGNEKIINYFNLKFTNKKKYLIIKNCGQDDYLSIAKNSILIIGNSSSGIVEAASIKVPVINLGNRQKGKIKPENVIDCKFNIKQITLAFKKIKTNSFLDMISKMKNPYEKKLKKNLISKIILEKIKNKNILKKRFIFLKKKYA